jgi:hypothetical protein
MAIESLQRIGLMAQINVRCVSVSHWYFGALPHISIASLSTMSVVNCRAVHVCRSYSESNCEAERVSLLSGITG